MTVSTDIVDWIGCVTIDNPPVNATSQAVRSGLMDAIEEMNAAGVAAVVLHCAGRTFIAGADVREFDRPPEAPILPEVIAALEATPVPWIAAIHGAALGGGLEIAMACAYRIVDDKARLGLPEVNLGLIPGAGGTVRLPRLIGLEPALEMIVTGRPLSARRALALGLADAMATDDLMQTATAFAQKAADRPRPVPAFERGLCPPEDPAQWENAITSAKSRARGQHSIVAAANAADRAVRLKNTEALKAERAAFQVLKADPQSAALRYIFFAERSVSKTARTDGASPGPLRNIGVIGGGTMGSGISAACLLSGLTVAMVETGQPAADAGLARVTDILNGAVKRGKLSEAGHRDALERFTAVTDYEALSNADLVIEAVFEDMDVKRAVFTELERVMASTTVLASNTSYLDVTELARSTAYPERVIGLHFFSPAHVMKLLEVITPATASGQAIATGMALSRALGKIAVPAGVCDGFIGNRIMSAYRRVADYMIVDGALPHEVDQAMTAFGFPMGVFQMQDLAGLDISWAMRRRKAATRDPAERYIHVADNLCEAGRLGRKSGRGWYDYSVDSRGAVDPEITRIITAESAALGITRVTLSSGRIMETLLDAMQAEGRALLAEGIAATPEAIDVVMVNGYGFPRWRGGPMYMSVAG